MKLGKFLAREGVLDAGERNFLCWKIICRTIGFALPFPVILAPLCSETAQNGWAGKHTAA